MALVGLVRVSTQKQETARQHDALDPICVKVFEEKLSGKLRVAERPGLQAALDYMRPGDMLTVQECDRLGRNLIEGLVVLTDLFAQGIAVKILDGIAKGEHVERSLILDFALAIAEDRRRDIARKTRDGLDAAAKRGRKGGRPTVLDDDRRRAILARRAEGQSLREIARGVGVSLAVVHGAVKASESSAAEPTPAAAAATVVLPGVRTPLPVDRRDPVPDPGRYDQLLPAARSAALAEPDATQPDPPGEPDQRADRGRPESARAWAARVKRWHTAPGPVEELVSLTRDRGTSDWRVTDDDGTHLGTLAREVRVGSGRGRWIARDHDGARLIRGPWNNRSEALTGLLDYYIDHQATKKTPRDGRRT